MKKREKNAKWWGWGSPQTRFDLSDRPGLLAFLERRGLIGVALPADGLTQLPSRAPSQTLQDLLPQTLKTTLTEAFAGGRISFDSHDRLIHSVGKSFPDLVRIRAGKVQQAPDLVFYPESEEDVVRFLKLASQESIAVIPWGGGSSVVAGLDACKGTHSYSAAVDLTGLDKVIDLDRVSGRARVQAGIYGPGLERALGEQGYTLGHFPQSFEFSTLGGWIAAKSSGQNSVLYGGIEDLVVSLKIATPQGLIETSKTPREAAGPELARVWLGSEGVLGIIVEAIVRVRPRPQSQVYFGYLFPTFAAAKDAVRTIAQSSLTPAMVRVSDEAETEASFAMARRHGGWLEKTTKKGLSAYLGLRGISVPGASLVIAGVEGEREATGHELRELKQSLCRSGGVYLGTRPGESWKRDRFYLPYLRDELLDRGVFAETMETSGTWAQLDGLYRTVRDALRRTAAPGTAAHDAEANPVVGCHISHFYRDGASLYFTVIAKLENDPLAQWSRIKVAACEAIREAGGAISHHHGIGRDHRSYLGWGPSERAAILAFKTAIDPNGIMNPEKLL